MITHQAINDYDIKDLLTSFDKAIKIRLTKENLKDDSLKPKIYLGENKEFINNENQQKYERPIINMYVTKRAPASLSDKNFFSGTLQHSAAFEEEINGERYKLLFRDNEIKLVLRAKTKNEIYLLNQIIERTFLFEKQCFNNCDLIRFVQSQDKNDGINDFYMSEIIFRARTKIFYKVIDNVLLSEFTINYQDQLCDYFDVINHRCTFKDYNGVSSEKEEKANDISCYKKTFCKNYFLNEKITIKR